MLFEMGFINMYVYNVLNDNGEHVLKNILKQSRSICMCRCAIERSACILLCTNGALYSSISSR